MKGFEMKTTQQTTPTHLVKAIDLVNQVMSRKVDFKLFVDALLSYQRAPSSELHNSNIALLFQDHPDLLHRFEEFLSDSGPSSPRIMLSDESANSSEDVNQDAFNCKRSANQAYDFLEKVRQRLQSADFLEFLEGIHCCRTRGFDRNESRKLIATFIGDFPDLMDKYDQFWEEFGKEQLERELINTSHKLEHSYHVHSAPPFWDAKSIPGTSPNNGKVNGGYYSMAIQNTEYSSWDVRGTRESNKYELDMSLECLRTTAESADSLLQQIKNDIYFVTPIQLQKHFSDPNLWCIRKLYSAYELEIIEMLENDPRSTLPVILSRLRQKKEECLKCLSQLNETRRPSDN